MTAAALAAIIAAATGAPVAVGHSACPDQPEAAGCADKARVYVNPSLYGAERRRVLLHELMHLADFRGMVAPQARRRFARSQGRSDRAWWRGKRPIAEWYAEAGAYCLLSRRDRDFAGLWVGFDGRLRAAYHWRPNRRQRRAACAQIRGMLA